MAISGIPFASTNLPDQSYKIHDVRCDECPQGFKYEPGQAQDFITEQETKNEIERVLKALEQTQKKH